MKKKLNLEKVLEAFKKEPDIPKKHGLNPENMKVSDLEDLDFSFLMDILFEFSNPIRRLNK